MSTIAATDKLIVDGNKRMLHPLVAIASNAENKAVLGDYTTVSGKYPTGRFPQAGAIVVHGDKFYRFTGSTESAFRTAPPSAGWTEVSASTGGGGGIPTPASPSSTPPSSPSIGQFWMSSAGASSPYVKNATYQWNGSRWVMLAAKKPQTVVVFSGTANAPSGASTFNTALTDYGNELNLSIGSTSLTIAETAMYNVLVTINPGSLFQAAAPADEAEYVGYILQLHHNGNNVAEDVSNFEIMQATVALPQKIGTTAYVKIMTELAAGDTIGAQIVAVNGSLSYGGSIQITRLPS